MSTLLEKWNSIEDTIAVLSNEFIENYFKDKDRPKIIYRMAGRSGIEELEVTEFGIYKQNPSKPWMDKRPTREKLKAFEEWFTDFIPDESMIYIHYRAKFGTGYSTSATTFAKVAADKHLSFSRDDLLPAWEEWKNVYSEKEGHIPCAYCMKQVLEKDAVAYTVIARQYPGGRKTSQYCSQECGTHDQWAHEG